MAKKQAWVTNILNDSIACSFSNVEDALVLSDLRPQTSSHFVTGMVMSSYLKFLSMDGGKKQTEGCYTHRD